MKAMYRSVVVREYPCCIKGVHQESADLRFSVFSRLRGTGDSGSLSCPVLRLSCKYRPFHSGAIGGAPQDAVRMRVLGKVIGHPAYPSKSEDRNTVNRHGQGVHR